MMHHTTKSRFLAAAFATVALAVSSASATSLATSENVYKTNSETALRALQTFYNETTGLWHSFGVSWWQSANALTTLADMVSLNTSTYALQVADHVFPNTFTQAQLFNIEHHHNDKKRKRQQTPWTNGFYDDEGWWAMGWIRVYDATKNETYLNASIGLFEDMTGGWGTNCSSQGLWWNKAHTQIAPIANVLFMEVAAYLANRVPTDKKQTYVEWAEKEWAWLQSSGVYLADKHLVGAGYNVSTCKLEATKHYSAYVDGTLIQALIELSAATENQSYIDEANLVAAAAIHAETQKGILQQWSVSADHPGIDLQQSKGVFMRGMMRLLEAQPNATFTSFLVTNAESIWANDRQNSTNVLGPVWQGPLVDPNASAHSSAMDALVAAWSATAGA